MNAPDDQIANVPPVGQRKGLGTRGRAGFASYLEIPFVHKRLILGSLLASILVSWLAVLFWSRTYESEAKMLLLVGPESVGFDPTATTGETLTLPKTQEEEINSVLDILGSRAVSELVVDELGEEAILSGTLPSAPTTPKSFGHRYSTFAKDTGRFWLDVSMGLLGVRDNIGDRERAIMKVQKTVQIHSPKKSTVITVRGEAKTPHMAQALVKSCTKNFIDIYLKVSPTSGSQDFFSAHVESAEKQLNGLVDNRSNFLQENKIGSIDDNRQRLTAQLADVDAELNSARSQLTQALAEIRNLNGRLADTVDEIIANEIEPSDASLVGIKQRLDELLLKEKEFAAKYTDSHVKLIQVREQIDGAQSILKESKTQRIDPSPTPNPVRLRLIEEVQKQETLVVGLRSAITAMEERRRDLEEQSKKLLEQELQIQQLDREIAVRESSFLSLSQKLEQSRMLEQFQMKQIPNVNVFQDATLVERATTPNKNMLATGIVSLGLLSGFGLAFLRERTSSRLRTAAHVESELGAPVLMSIPFRPGTSNLSSFVRDSRNSRLRDVFKSILSDVLFSRCHAASSGIHAASPGIRGRTMGVLSVRDGGGASTLAAALALTASEDCGLRTTLIDADLRDKTISRAFGLDGSRKESELKSAHTKPVDSVPLTTEAPINLVSGYLETGDRIDSSRLLEFQHDYDLVVVDLPPARRLDHAMAITRDLDLIVLVVESGVTETIELQRVVRRLKAANTCVVGVVLNKVEDSMPKWLRSLVT